MPSAAPDFISSADSVALPLSQVRSILSWPLVFAATSLAKPSNCAVEARFGPQIWTRQVVSAGNFHGMPLALALDTLLIALAHVAGISERRTYYILAASDAENPLNPQLAPVPGLCSGLMIAQYVAAACCNELIGLATPASVANLPTSAGIEDYNSMGATSARKARRALDRVTDVVAIELLCAAEALEYQRPLRSGAGVEAAFAAVREVVPRRTGDRPPAPEIRALGQLIRSGRFGTE